MRRTTISLPDDIAEALDREAHRRSLPVSAVARDALAQHLGFGPCAEAAFLRGLATLDIEAPSGEDLERVAELVEQYVNLPLGGTDATVIALAARLGTTTVVTLDHRHFGAVKPRHCQAFELLP